MKKNISIIVDEEIYNKFKLVIWATGENEDSILAEAMKKYISENFKHLLPESCTSVKQNNIVKMKKIKAETHQSWVNLRKAIYKRKNIPYRFGTVNVEASAEHFLNRILRETSFSLEDILRYLNDNKLG